MPSFRVRQKARYASLFSDKAKESLLMLKYYYNRFLYTYLKWFGVALSVVSAIIFFFVLFDLLIYHKWGYPWHTAPFALLMFFIGRGMRAVAIFAQKHIEKP
jgi:hypothetical protein